MGCWRFRLGAVNCLLIAALELAEFATTILTSILYGKY